MLHVKYKKTENDRIILEFPQSKVIYLEHNSTTPDELILELRIKNQGSFEYKIPTMKFLDYSINELNKQHLVILLPLYLLKLRREINREQSKENALKLKALINEGILKTIEDNEKAGNITHEDVIVLIALLERLYKHLYGNIKKFKEEGVNEMLSEKLILDVDRILYNKELELEKREEKKALEIAENLLDLGIPIEQIKIATKLSISKIKKLQKQKQNQ